ncbi:hypothetical protein F444_22113 [Phytophthora nicotianae P1976]|uniref:Uncharacterized protein n=1 Tax=Phytophthora nicotianae P1976 TaxID=1317066 RepID=A0A080YYQ9_PHYNI|nr:hypothetical protein F444_22113 [Phytophthora nicotianae P1976]
MQPSSDGVYSHLLLRLYAEITLSNRAFGARKHHTSLAKAREPSPVCFPWTSFRVLGIRTPYTSDVSRRAPPSYSSSIVLARNAKCVSSFQTTGGCELDEWKRVGIAVYWRGPCGVRPYLSNVVLYRVEVVFLLFLLLLSNTNGSIFLVS